MKGVNKIGFSVAKPKLKASKMSFVRAKKAQTIKAEDLKGQETVSTTSLASTLSETNRILVEIQNQLAIDFANRIAERKAVIKASKLGVRKKKLVEKEDFVERGKGFLGNIKEFGKKVLSPLSNIFDKIKNFLLLVGGGIILNNAWEWLSKKENREKLIAVLTFLKNHWKTIVGLIIGAKLLGALGKLVNLARAFRKLIKGLNLTRGGQSKPNVPTCNFVWNCLTAPAVQGTTAFATFIALLAGGLLDYFRRGGSLLPEFQGIFNPKVKEGEKETILASTAQQQSEPLKSFTGREIPTSLAGVLSELQAEYVKTGKPVSRLTPQGFLSVRATAPNRANLGGLFGLSGPDLTPQISFNPELTPESNQAAVSQAEALFTAANLPATLAPILGARGAIGRSISSASKRSSLEGFRAPNVPPVKIPTPAPTDSSFKDTSILARFIRNFRRPDKPKKFITTSRSGLGDRAAKSTETSIQGERARRDVEKDLKDDNFEEFLKLLQTTGQATLTNDPKIPKRSEGGTIPGRGPQNVDSVPALLAPGEEVIRASAANMFRPVLKDINSNAGRLFGEFRSGVEQQKSDLSLQRDTTQKSIGILSDFKEFIERFTNELKVEQFKKKRKELEGLLGSLGIRVNSNTSEDSSAKTSPIPEISQQTFTPSSFTLPSFTQQEAKLDENLVNLNASTARVRAMMDMVKTNSQGTKPIDQPLRRRTTNTTEGQVATATLPMQTISLPADPMPIKEQPQEYAEEKIEIQPMDMSNPYILFTLNNYNLD